MVAAATVRDRLALVFYTMINKVSCPYDNLSAPRYCNQKSSWEDSLELFALVVLFGGLCQGFLELHLPCSSALCERLDELGIESIMQMDSA